jgi:hypothetical protein
MPVNSSNIGLFLFASSTIAAALYTYQQLLRKKRHHTLLYHSGNAALTPLLSSLEPVLAWCHLHPLLKRLDPQGQLQTIFVPVVRMFTKIWLKYDERELLVLKDGGTIALDFLHPTRSDADRYDESMTHSIIGVTAALLCFY